MTAGWVKSWDDSSRPVPISRLPEMYAAGYRVWMRYLALGSEPKHWDAAQIHAWFACGPDTGVVGLVEGTGTEPVTNPTSGAWHASDARRAADTLGWPAAVSLVPAMDENVTAAQWRGPIVQYLRAWRTGDTCRPVMYIESDAGAYLDALGLTVGTFSPAAWGWDNPAKLLTPANAPGHVVMTQEHNGRNQSGGNIDAGNTRTSAPCVWWNPEGVSPMAMAWTDQVVESGDPTNPEWSVAGALKWMVSQLRMNKTIAAQVAANGNALSALSAKVAAIGAAQAPTIDYDALAAAILAAVLAKGAGQ